MSIIDLQWIRNHRDQVQDWQRRRGLDESKVTDAATEDQECRQLLHKLRLGRERFNVLAKELRIHRGDPTLLEERKKLKVLIPQLEQELISRQEKLYELLKTLGSPVDDFILQKFKTLSEIDIQTDPMRITQKQENRPLHWLQTQSIFHSALVFFGRKYSTLQSFRGLEPCISTPTTTPTSTTVGSLTDFPAWQKWITQNIPSKSIFGAKQVPRYTLMQDNTQEQLELIAMTPGTMWDSRQVQLELAQELLSWYKSILTNHHTLALLATSPRHLHQHELSRIDIVVLENNNTTKTTTTSPQILGSVSNWGDAMSRAQDLRFKGGGLAESKLFVHWVHATILGPCNLDHLSHYPLSSIYSYEHHHQENYQHGEEKFNTDNKETKPMVLMAPPRMMTRLGVSSPRMKLTNNSKSEEALSCPFGFLIPSLEST